MSLFGSSSDVGADADNDADNDDERSVVPVEIKASVSHAMSRYGLVLLMSVIHVGGGRPLPAQMDAHYNPGPDPNPGRFMFGAGTKNPASQIYKRLIELPIRTNVAKVGLCNWPEWFGPGQ